MRRTNPLEKLEKCRSITAETLAVFFSIFAYICLAPVCGASSSLGIPAFPGAEGYGMFASGGRGGDVYEVTSLADSGPGTLRDAVAGGNRTVVFRVSGTIDLDGPICLDFPNITIAGQTAPGDGICLKNFGIRINSRNIIVRFLRIRPGDLGSDDQVDGIGMGPRGGDTIVVDHCSVSWGIDENCSIYGLPNVTVQWCIISEALHHSKHPKGGHSMGGIMNGYNATFHHNLFVSNNDRNPKFDVADWWPGKNTDFRNNVIYNWGRRATWGGNGGATLTNVVNNYYKPGPSSTSAAFLCLAGGHAGEWYVDGNVLHGDAGITRENWAGVANTSKKGPLNAQRLMRQVSHAPVFTESAPDALKSVLQHAGAVLPKRDAVDERIIRDVGEGSGKIIDSQREVGGWPHLSSIDAPPDVDHDGIPDDWEVLHGLNPHDPADRNIDAGTGYTMLEEYLNSGIPNAVGYNGCPLPAEAFWPNPASGAIRIDCFPNLRWKAGFSSESERIFFGMHPRLTECDLKEVRQVECRYVNKQEISSSCFSPGRLALGLTYYWRIDGVNARGVTTGETWSFTTGSPVEAEAGVRIEAEQMTISGGSLEASLAASGGYLVAVPSGCAELGFTFCGESGRYNIALTFVDETDGTGEISVQVNGRTIAKIRADADSGAFVRHVVPCVGMVRDDVVKIVTARHRDELGRIDFVELEPCGVD